MGYDNYGCLIKKYNLANLDNFNSNISDAFIEAEKIDPTNGVNELFTEVLKLNITVENVKFMISLGADPRFNNDLPFAYSCINTNKNIDIPYFFITQYHVDVNIRNEMICSAISPIILKLVLVHGFIYTYHMMQYHKRSLPLVEIFINNVSCFQKYVYIYHEMGCCAPYVKVEKEISRLILIKLKEMIDLIVPIDVLNKVFIRICRSIDISLEDLHLMINLGVDPRYDDDHLFILSCGWADNKIMLYLINECGCNINREDNEIIDGLIVAKSVTNLKILLDIGMSITDYAIIKACDNLEYIKLFVDYGIDLDRIGKLFLEYSFKNNELMPIAKFLVSNNVDITQMIKHYSY